MSMHRSTSLKSQRNPERYICKIFENIFLYFYLSLLGALRDNVYNRVSQILMETNQLATFKLGQGVELRRRNPASDRFWIRDHLNASPALYHLGHASSYTTFQWHLFPRVWRRWFYWPPLHQNVIQRVNIQLQYKWYFVAPIFLWEQLTQCREIFFNTNKIFKVT